MVIWHLLTRLSLFLSECFIADIYHGSNHIGANTIWQLNDIRYIPPYTEHRPIFALFQYFSIDIETMIQQNALYMLS